MHCARQMLGCIKFALNEGLLDDDFRCDIREFTPLLGVNLLSHRLEVPLHPVYTYCDAVDQRERTSSVSRALE